jgi:hypothetical protein
VDEWTSHCTKCYAIQGISLCLTIGSPSRKSPRKKAALGRIGRASEAGCRSHSSSSNDSFDRDRLIIMVVRLERSVDTVLALSLKYYYCACSIMFMLLLSAIVNIYDFSGRRRQQIILSDLYT